LIRQEEIIIIIMADGLSKSLDDLIKESRSSRKSNDSSKGNGKGKGGAVKGNRDSRGIAKPKASLVSKGHRDARIQQQQQQPYIKKPFDHFDARNDNKSILSRVGSSDQGRGVEVVFSNLNPDIPAADIQELCETIGTVIRTNKARNGKIFAGFERARYCHHHHHYHHHSSSSLSSPPSLVMLRNASRNSTTERLMEHPCVSS